MQFKSWEERQSAVKKATEELGKAYGEIKFKEFMLKEVSQSFVSGEVQQPPKEEEVKPAESAPVESTKPKATRKRKPAPKINKEETKVEEREEVQPVAEEVKEEAQPKKEEVAQPVEAPVEETSGVEEAAEDCPIKSSDDLRAFMTKRFKELGANSTARDSLVNALKESTGVGQAAEVPEDKFPAAHTALSELSA